MTKVVRRAAALWNGNLIRGKGFLRFATGASGGFNWAARVERSDGKTSPEELIAAAHAACYSMSLSSILSARGYTPESLMVDASCVLEYVEKRFKITTMILNVSGKVSGMDLESFEEAAHVAEESCPVSNALRGNLKIQLQVKLEPVS